MAPPRSILLHLIEAGHFVYWQHYVEGDHVAADTSRIAASVVTGIGFLAGGAIFRTGATVQGLTTAALWLNVALLRQQVYARRFQSLRAA